MPGVNLGVSSLGLPILLLILIPIPILVLIFILICPCPCPCPCSSTAPPFPKAFISSAADEDRILARCCAEELNELLEDECRCKSTWLGVRAACAGMIEPGRRGNDVPLW